MKNADRNRGNSPSNPVTQSTLLVDTDSLKSQGIDQIRVLSESRFLELLGDMTAASPSSNGGELKASVASPEARDVSVTQQRRWDSLRRRHQEKLRKIETGMERLSSTFSSIQEVLGRLGSEQPTVAATPEPALPVAAASKPEVDASEPRPRRSQQDLLKEMLL